MKTLSIIFVLVGFFATSQAMDNEEKPARQPPYLPYSIANWLSENNPSPDNSSIECLDSVEEEEQVDSLQEIDPRDFKDIRPFHTPDGNIGYEATLPNGDTVRCICLSLKKDTATLALCTRFTKIKKREVPIALDPKYFNILGSLYLEAQKAPK